MSSAQDCHVCALDAYPAHLLEDAFGDSRSLAGTAFSFDFLSAASARSFEVAGFGTTGDLAGCSSQAVESVVGRSAVAELKHTLPFIQPTSDCPINWAAVVSDLLSFDDERYETILQARGFRNPAGRRFVGDGSSTALSQRLGVGSTRVRQLGDSAWSLLIERVQSHRFLVYQRALEVLTSLLGPLWKTEYLALPPCLEALRHSEWELHIQLVAPYEEADGWRLFHNGEVTPRHLRDAVRSACPASSEDLQGLLVSEGVLPVMASAFLAEMEELRSHDGLFYWVEGNPASEAVWALQTSGLPLSLDELERRSSSQGARHRIQSDERISRVGIDCYALTSWELREYHGIASEVRLALEAGGGAVRLEELKSDLATAFGVSPTSVATYAGNGEFMTRDGYVRFRNPADDPAHTVAPNKLERSCFQMQSGRWAVRLPIDRDARRGSGRPVPLAWITQFDVDLGRKKTIRVGNYEVTLSRKTRQPSIGSLRRIAEPFSDGDNVFLWPTSHDSAEFLVAPSDRDNLMDLVGRPDLPVDLEEIAFALGVDEASWVHIRTACIARGDDELLAMLPAGSVATDASEIMDMLGLGK